MPLNLDKTTIFGIQKTLLESQVHFDKLLNFAIGAVAVAGTFTPLMFPKAMDRESKLLTLLLGAVSAGGLCINMELGKRKSKIFKTFDESQLQAFREECQHEIAYDRTTRTIEAQRRLAREISELPAHEHPRWIGMYGLDNLIAPALPPVENSSSSNGNDNAWINNPFVTQDKPEVQQEQASPNWLLELVEEAIQPLANRNHQHLIINAPTQKGKTTLAACLVGMFGKVLNGELQTLVIDPKNSNTNWLVNVDYAGFQSVVSGMRDALKILDERKKTAEQTRKKGLPHPSFPRLLVIFDEWNLCYGRGKGYSDIISNDQASELLAGVERLLAESAFVDITLVLIGQSPLSGDNGLSRPMMENATRITMSKTCTRWLKDKDFPDQELKAPFLKQIKLWEREKRRYAMVLPMVGEPYLELVPHINLSAFETSAEIEETEDNQDTPELTDIQRVFLVLQKWVSERETPPTGIDVWKVWEKLTGQQLDAEALGYLLEKLGLNNENVSSASSETDV